MSKTEPQIPHGITKSDALWVAQQFMDGMSVSGLAERMLWATFTVEAVLRATLKIRGAK